MRLTLILLSLYAFLFQGFLGATGIGAAAAGPVSSIICQSSNQSVTGLNDAAPAAPASPHKHIGDALCCAPCCRILALASPDAAPELAQAAELLKHPPSGPTPLLPTALRPPRHARGPPLVI